MSGVWELENLQSSLEEIERHLTAALHELTPRVVRNSYITFGADDLTEMIGQVQNARSDIDELLQARYEADRRDLVRADNKERY